MLLAWQTESSNVNRDAIALVDSVLTNVPMILFLYMHSFFNFFSQCPIFLQIFADFDREEQ